MGNMPNRWGGRAASVALALLLALGGGLVGLAVGDRLANGFAFDWYVQPGKTAFPSGDVLTAIAILAGGVSVLAIALAVPIAAVGTRLWAARLRFVPPRYKEPRSIDVHAGILVVALGLGMALVTALVGYVVLALPMAQGGSLVERVSPEGFVLMATAAGALAGLVAGLVGSLTTFSGVVSGRIAKDASKNLIAHVSLAGMKYAKTTVALVLVTTLVAGYYATSVNTNVDVADVLPRGDPNTDAAHNLTQKFKSSFTQQVTFQLHVLNQTNASQKELYEKQNAKFLGNRTTTPNPDNITDELYVRAMDQLVQFVLAQKGDDGKPVFVGSVGNPDFYKLINWTIAGGQTSQNTAGNASFALPDTTREGEMQYSFVETGVNRVGAVYQAVDAVTSPSWRQTAYLVTVDPKANLDSKAIGEAALKFREAWLEKTKTDPNVMQVFGEQNPPQFSVDLPLANAHASELTKHDFSLLLPIIAVFIAVTLFIAFRSIISVFITFSMLVVALLWTFGVMGVMRIPMNTLNLATVPLIMGVGIDYGIHMMNEYDELRHQGKSPQEAWTLAGGGSAMALFVGTLTTISGLLIMIVSPSLLVAQTGLLSAIAIASCFTLAILFIPAVTTLVSKVKDPVAGKTHKEYQPSRIMPAFATGVSRARWFVLLVLVLVAAASIASAANIRREAFGDPPRNWLETDALRMEHERAVQGFYDSPTSDEKANVLIFEGDITDPQAHDYIAAITSTLRQNAMTGKWTDENGVEHPSRVIADTLKDLPFLVNTYITVRNGVPGAAQLVGGDALSTALAPLGQTSPTNTSQAYPRSREAVKAMLDETYRSPLYQLANLFVDHPTYEMTVTIFSVKAATYNDAAEAWAEVQRAIEVNKDLKPEHMHASFFGNTAINYLFVAKQVPWLTYMSVGTNIAVILIVFAFTRNVRTTLVVGACNFLSSTLWLGALTLPFIDIGIAISLTLPLIFIFCMGSDYGLHLALRCKKSGDTRSTFEGVGKGVLYSFITTFGAFLVFTQVSDLAGRRAMIATAVAIGVVFVMTLAVVPILFPVKKRDKRGGVAANQNVPVVETKKVAAVPAAGTTGGGGATTPRGHHQD